MIQCRLFDCAVEVVQSVQALSPNYLATQTSSTLVPSSAICAKMLFSSDSLIA